MYTFSPQAAVAEKTRIGQTPACPGLCRGVNSDLIFPTKKWKKMNYDDFNVTCQGSNDYFPMLMNVQSFYGTQILTLS